MMSMMWIDAVTMVLQCPILSSIIRQIQDKLSNFALVCLNPNTSSFCTIEEFTSLYSAWILNNNNHPYQ